MKCCIVGIDPGRQVDPTGVVVVTADYYTTGSPDASPLGRPAEYAPAVPYTKVTRPPALEVGHVERMPLGVPYPTQVRLLRGFLQLPALWKDGPPDSVWDATGLGMVVRDEVIAAGIARARFISIHGGVRAHFDKGYWRVSKTDLVMGVVVALEDGRLRFARSCAFAEALRQELLAFKVKVSASGRDTYGAGEEPGWREGKHDDLVLALAIATWWANRTAKHAQSNGAIPASAYGKLRR